MNLKVIKKYILIVLQALCVSLISACICVYYISSRVGIYYNDTEVRYNTSLGELRNEYYSSTIFKENFKEIIYEITDYVSIKNEIETDGEYDPNKKIYIGKYTYRFDEDIYEGPDACYYLKDLIAWGQYGISQDGISHSYKVFDSWEELDNFFGKEDKTPRNSEAEFYISEDGVDSDVNENQIPMLDVISNRYKSVDNMGLEYYAANEDEYNILVGCLENTATMLYQDYCKYVVYKERFSFNSSNIRYYISTGEGTKKTVYTNIPNYRALNSEKLMETIKNYGRYLYAATDKLDFLTNTNIDYDDVKNAILLKDYVLKDNPVIYLAIDETYARDDLFSHNYTQIQRTHTLVPWLISMAVVGLILFVVILVLVCMDERKRLSYVGAYEELKEFDKLPIEIETLFFIIFGAIIYFLRLFFFSGYDPDAFDAIPKIVPMVSAISFAYAILGLLFVYCIVRRAVTHSILKKSIFYVAFKWIGNKLSFIKRWFWKIYDSAGVAIRTWGLYLFFLIFNTFWACMLFFSEIPVISFLVLFIFDTGTGILLFNKNWEQKKIVDGIKKINDGDFDYKIETTKMHGDNKEFADTVNEIGSSIRDAVETSSKDEKLKADLITNVSHDIKTPLTSIINYVDLIKRENIENERVKSYVKILDEKSQRLKQLTMDLVEASKITSGNITLEINKMNFIELINQAKGEFEEKFESKGLSLLESIPKGAVIIEADPRYVWRIVENLLQNVYKYAMENTRVYMDINLNDDSITMSIKNISSQQLNINADELTERFIRGDVARSTEGSGLGLSIVKSLVKAHNGSFDVYLDGDLFKTTVTLPLTQN